MGTAELPYSYCTTSTTNKSVGGGKRDRTADLLHAMQALSQLSYTPVSDLLKQVNGAHDMKPHPPCQRLNLNILSSAEKAANPAISL